MTRNVCLLDRAARLVIGVALLGLYGALESPWRYVTLLGLVFIATAATAACPVYGLMGWSTRRRVRSELEKPADESGSNDDRTWPPKKPPPWRPSDPE